MNYHNIEFVSSFKYNEKCNIIIQKVKELVEVSDFELETYINFWLDYVSGKEYDGGYVGSLFGVEFRGVLTLMGAKYLILLVHG